MAPSPRRRASRSSFNQTWDRTDAAFLDPASLPIGRIPRGWERKQETKKTEEGREKKIWRRFNLRSRAPDTSEEVDEEEHDVRSRAVKKQQYMSPKAMEKTTAKTNGKERAFKATRWDRRKSVLPRKRSSRTEDPAAEAHEAADESAESENAQDNNGGSLNQDLFQVEPAIEPTMEDAQDILPGGASRRGTFTFTVQAEGDGFGESLSHSMGDDIDYPVPRDDQGETVVFMTTVGLQRGLEAAAAYTMDDATIQEGPIITEEMVAQQDASPKDACSRDFAMEHDAEPPIQRDPRPEEPHVGHAETTDEVAYPTLPTDTMDLDTDEPAPSTSQKDTDDVERSNEGSEIVEETVEDVDDAEAIEEDTGLLDAADQSSDEEFTEASMQLDILRDYQDTLRGRQLVHTEDAEDDDTDTRMDAVDESESPQRRGASTPAPTASHVEDITDGLTLSFMPQQSTPAKPASRKSQSPALPIHSAADDATMTIALDDDTALLQGFLSRAAASKAEKAALMTHRRESLQNRRDSDVVRHALASPRKALEEKDPNSPSKYDIEMTLDLSDTNGLSANQAGQDDVTDEKSMRGSRRSSRTKRSRLPAPASVAPASTQTSKISIRRPDGTDHVVLKKSDAQELALLTKANTRKNKQGAFGVSVRLLKLAVDAASLPPLDDSTKELVIGKNIRWDEQLAYYQENPDTIADAVSLATPDELGMPDEAPKKSKVSKNSTPKIRRVRGLGTANGTPGKALLAPASLLPEDVQEEKESAQAPPPQQLPKPRASKIKKMPVASSAPSTAPIPPDTKLPSLDIAPVGVTPTKERKSRLAAPKKVVLPQHVPSVPGEGKENAQRIAIGGAAQKKGIPAPKVNVPATLGMDSGLPRRRGRRI